MRLARLPGLKTRLRLQPSIVFRALPVHALTRICSVEYIKRVESVFEIIAEPNRRAILSLLVSSQQSVGEIERQLRMPQPTVSKHLRVLREAGFVESTVDAQRRLYRLNLNHFRRWICGWLSSAGSGPLTWMLSNATLIAWITTAWIVIHQHQQKGRKD